MSNYARHKNTVSFPLLELYVRKWLCCILEKEWGDINRFVFLCIIKNG